MNTWIGIRQSRNQWFGYRTALPPAAKAATRTILVAKAESRQQIGRD
jgi:hypothetical protein